eukprot:TRINITY_DN465_c0_g1_i3.p1 TRINITY_DN465_c0_g1~~TRINITY_DN465_c0_g1_i3.p1  ORF type:complete len:122 (-),score=17.66 TRINITY_DN465_c0_g1_i3:251-616(-)
MFLFPPVLLCFVRFWDLLVFTVLPSQIPNLLHPGLVVEVTFPLLACRLDEFLCPASASEQLVLVSRVVCVHVCRVSWHWCDQQCQLERLGERAWLWLAGAVAVLSSLWLGVICHEWVARLC